MKANSIIIFLFLINICFAQKSSFNIIPDFSTGQQNNIENKKIWVIVMNREAIKKGINWYTVKDNNIQKATRFEDMMEGYPESWLAGNYISTAISGIINGERVEVKGKDSRLNKEQMNLLKEAKINSNLEIYVNYVHHNAINNKKEHRKMEYTLTVVPATEAKFPEGCPSEYLNKAINKMIKEGRANDFISVDMEFTINRKGKTTEVRITESSGVKNTDKMLLELINNMPDWEAAKDASGNKVKQIFELRAGYGIGC